MNEISLVFYGELSKMQNHLLVHLKLLKILPATEARTGFYAIESRFGREFPRKLSLDPLNQSGEAVLLFRYLTEEELQQLESSTSIFYILPHKMLDRDYIKKILLPRFPQAGFISDYSGGSLVHGVTLVRKEFKTANVLRLKSAGQQHYDNETARPFIQVPVLILFLLKIFMNPVSEVRRYSILIKYSNLRILSRFLELFLAFEFVVNAVFIKLLRQLVIRGWYSSNYLMGLVRVVLIKLGFAIRHVFLMSGFKSYGVVVDTYFSVNRWLAALIKLVVYRGLYFLYYHVVYFLYYRVGFFLYYHAGYFLYYRVGYFLYYRVGYFLVFRVFHFIYYSLIFPAVQTCYAVIRHAVLISIFKLYGLLFNICTFSYRFTKLILLYPVFKTYWFLSFQYKKRIKKLLL